MKKTIVLFLMVCVLLAMTACNNIAPPSTTAESTAAPATDEETTEVTPETTEVKTLSIFIDHSWYPTKTFTGVIPEEITRLTGVKLDPTVAIDGEQLGVMIASAELPDLVYTWAADRLASPDISYDYDSLIAEYNVDWTITNVQRVNNTAWAPDGKLYGIRNQNASAEEWSSAAFGVPMQPSLKYRADILKALGNPEVNNLDDLTNVFGMIKEQMPDITPFTYNVDWRWRVFRVWYGISLPFIEQSDGSYKHYINTTSYYDMLKMLNNWYRAGYMTADSFAATNTTCMVPWETGKAFTYSHCTQGGGDQAKLSLADPSFIGGEFKPLGKTDYFDSATGWCATLITKNCSDPEAAIKFMAWMFTPEAQMLCQNGREGIEYTLDGNGIPTFSQEWMDAAANDKLVEIYNPWFYLGGSPIAETFGRCATLKNYEAVADTYTAIRNGYKNLPWMAAASPITGMEEKDILDTIDAMINNFEAKIIMSASDDEFEQNYTEYMTAAQSSGMATLEAYMGQKIPEVAQLYN